MPNLNGERSDRVEELDQAFETWLDEEDPAFNDSQSDLLSIVLDPVISRLSSITRRSSLLEMSAALELTADEESALESVGDRFRFLVSFILDQAKQGKRQADLGDMTFRALVQENANQVQIKIRELIGQQRRVDEGRNDADVDFYGVSKVVAAAADLQSTTDRSRVFRTFFVNARRSGDWGHARDALAFWLWFPGEVQSVNEKLELIAIDAGLDLRLDDFRVWLRSRIFNSDTSWPQIGVEVVDGLLPAWKAAMLYLNDAAKALFEYQGNAFSEVHSHTSLLLFQPGIPLPEKGLDWPASMHSTLGKLHRAEQFRYRRLILELLPVLVQLQKQSAGISSDSVDGRPPEEKFKKTSDVTEMGDTPESKDQLFYDEGAEVPDEFRHNLGIGIEDFIEGSATLIGQHFCRDLPVDGKDRQKTFRNRFNKKCENKAIFAQAIHRGLYRVYFKDKSSLLKAIQFLKERETGK